MNARKNNDCPARSNLVQLTNFDKEFIKAWQEHKKSGHFRYSGH